MDRRAVLGLGLSAAVLGLAAKSEAEAMSAAGTLSTDPTETVNLWPGVPPGGQNVHLATQIVDHSPDTLRPADRYVFNIGTPLFTVFRPEHPNGTAVLIAPGGGYFRIVIDREGIETARWLNACGVTAFLLRYRLPHEGWENGQDVPLQDAQRAIRLIRAGAKKFAINPAKLGILGFSAGGHLAASLATRYDVKVYEPVDKADTVDARPTFACLMYAATAMGNPGGCAGRVGPDSSPAQCNIPSLDKLVTENTPPCFIAMAADDPVVPPFENGFAMFKSLQAAKVKSELHIFEGGGHGFGISRAAGSTSASWPDLFLAWVRGHGFITA